MTSPMICVVIPAFNAIRFLAQTIASIQAQTCADWEALIIDDGSTDDTAAVVRTLQGRESRLRLLTVPNRGVSAARNLGVAETDSPLIAFLDADDLWHPDKLRIHLECHARQSDLGVSFAQVEFLSPEGLASGIVASHPHHALRPVDFLCENPTTTTSNWVLRREVFETVGGFVEDMGFSEDLEWLLRVACEGSWRIAPIDHVLTYYRTTPDGLSSNLQQMEEGWLRLIAEARGYAPLLVQKHFARAQAVQLRFLARRSLRLEGDPAVGVDFLLRALRSDWHSLIREPRRTGLTALSLLTRQLQHICRGWFTHHAHPPRPRPDLVTRSGFTAETEATPMGRPLVTVVMPLYNAASTVRESLESVLAQTYRHLEILVVDDGCTDASVSICREYGDPRIRIIQQSNRGLAGARNTGIRQARGTILAFLDSDDLWKPQKIERHVAHLSGAPEVGVSYSRSAFIDRDSKPLGLYQTPPLHAITPELILCRNPISNGSCVVIRRTVLDDIRYETTNDGEAESAWFDDTFRQSEDLECWLRIALQTQWRIEGIGEPLTLYRLSNSGLSANIEKQFTSWQRVIDKTAGYAPELIRRYGKRALAYQLRYLARRAIRERQPRQGAKLIQEALRRYPRLLLEEPLRTLITLAAAILGVLLPQKLYRPVENLMIRITGLMQRISMGERM